MEEKVLIKSEQYHIKKVFIIMLIVGIVLCFLGSILCISYSFDVYNNEYVNHEHTGWCLDRGEYDCFYTLYDNVFSFALSQYFPVQFLICLIPIAASALICGLIYLWLSSYDLTVTDKRIYGKVAWGKRVDLPVDSVSATATTRLFKGVSIATSSGRISFRVIKNADEIYKVISNLLIERQQEKVNATVAATAPKSDEADQIKKYKDLLDSGVITQEEFDAKKKQLLGL